MRSPSWINSRARPWLPRAGLREVSWPSTIRPRTAASRNSREPMRCSPSCRILSLSSMRLQLHLTPLVQADVSDIGPQQRWTLVAKAGRVTGPASMAGFTLLSVAGYAPDFVRHSALKDWALPPDVKIESTGQILSALRRVAAGESVAALLDQTQAAALPTLPFASRAQGRDAVRRVARCHHCSRRLPCARRPCTCPAAGPAQDGAGGRRRRLAGSAALARLRAARSCRPARHRRDPAARLRPSRAGGLRLHHAAAACAAGTERGAILGRRPGRCNRGGCKAQRS